ncbi:glycosyltransferase family 4 protein [Caulobacter endophyticus]|uniref:glycosyltransferase family 4 protein n=1 Tax=Caulobacter endophyticus TaxID=2172652 RepID=UPI00240EB367|nr:glycosyltransferase family 4 protein [Caulobacter endophyticus]MDG2531890.1 glycosyltransferase family 4 protein [Caulobacter endophyticus]
MQYKIGFPYVGDRFGGSNMSSLIMATALRDRGHDVTVFTHGPGRAHDEAAARGLKTELLPALSDIGGYERPDRARPEQLAAFPHCWRSIKRHGLDIIHTNDMTMLRTWALPSLASGSKLIAHWRTSSKASASIAGSLLPAKKIISVSGYSKAILPGWLQKKTTVEFNALETFWSAEQRAQAKKAVRERLNLPADAALVGVFGNLTRRKRAHVLADILHALPEPVAGRPVYGLACGGPVEPLDTEFDLKRQAYGLMDRLIAPGFVRPVYEWMAACDVILAPAEREPLARNILEAMALGVPVVASTDGGLVEVLRDGENGFLLAPRETDRWIEIVRRLLNDVVLAERIALAGQRTAETLSVANHARRIEDIYRAAIS